MEYFNTESTFNLKSESDIFSIPSIQSTIEEGYFQEYRPITPLSNDAPIEFLIPAHTMEYLDLSFTKIHIKAQITKINGDKLSNATTKDLGDVVGPVNNFLHSLFGNVQLFLNKKCISSSSNLYHYGAYIENLLNYGMDAKKTHLRSVIWEKDSYTHMDSMTKDNKGFLCRKILFSESQIVDMEGVLHCDLFNQNKHLLNGVEMSLKLHRNKNNFCIISASPNDYKIEIKEAYLTIRKLKYNPSVMIAHAKTLLHTTAKYPITRVELKASTIPMNVQNKTLDNLFLGQLPKRIIIGLVLANAFNGSAELNPYNFQNFGVNSVSIIADSYIRTESYTPDFENGHYVSSYNGLFLATGKHYKDVGNDISREEYANGYCLFGFDLSPDFCASHRNIQRSGSLGIDLRFSKPLENSVTALVYAEFDNMIEVDKDRNIMMDYSS